MAMLRIIPDGDGALPEMAGKVVHEVQSFAVTSLTGGMRSGNPSVAVIVELPNGEWVFAETSLKLFLAAGDAFKARHGDPRRDDPAGTA